MGTKANVLKGTSFVRDGMGGFRRVSDPFNVAGMIADLTSSSPYGNLPGSRDETGMYNAEGKYIVPADYPGGQDAYDAMIASGASTPEEYTEIMTALGEDYLAINAPPDLSPSGNLGIYSDSIGGDAVDLGSALSLFPDPVTGAVSAAQQNDYLNSIIEESGQRQGPTDAQILELMVANQAAGVPRFISDENGIRPATAEETTEHYNNIISTLGGTPAQTTPAQTTPAQTTPAQTTPAQTTPAQNTPAITGPVDTRNAVDKFYDAVVGGFQIPEWATPEVIGIDPTTGQATVVFGESPVGTKPIGGSVGTVNQGTIVGVTTTGSDILDAILRGAVGGMDDGSLISILEEAVGSIANLPPSVLGGLVDAVGTVREGITGNNVTDKPGDGTDVVLTNSATNDSETVENIINGASPVVDDVVPPVVDDVVPSVVDNVVPPVVDDVAPPVVDVPYEIDTFVDTGGPSISVEDFMDDEKTEVPSERVSGGGGGDEEDTPEQIINQGISTVRTEKAGLADIGTMYNPSLSFAENMAALNNARKKDETGDLYSGGGMIQNIDLTDEIDRLLRGY